MTEFVTTALTAGRPASFARLGDLSDCDRSELVRVGLWSLAVVPMAIDKAKSQKEGKLKS